MSGPVQIPLTLSVLTRRLPAFRGWLVQNGSEIYAPTSRYEVLRFRTQEGVGIIYRNETGGLSWVNGASDAMRCFLGAKPWRPGTAPVKNATGARHRLALYRSLVERDGYDCLYCGRLVPLEEFSKEHIVSRTHGGPDHLTNLAITHAACNAAASHLSAREKFEMAFEMRAATIIEEDRGLMGQRENANEPADMGAAS